ncbi:hypothetical protein QTL86_19520 [Cellulosilyticum sp. ST5]|uniref:hypothetical protein n=1 Tax=unclassified Cellulosilyticum TaxID=2643091 RepID=UPI000F8CAC4D|nr:hypothetical protein [Cellulosilyticum sp. WCF-2]QEH67231.1 hypothetical protein EKH84_01795 [Cellulosilyticum sp. WCF-2]
MERPNEFIEKYGKGKKLIVAIIVGRIILECLSIAAAISRESGGGAAAIGCIIWAILLVKLYSGSIWVPYVIATLQGISTLIGIRLLLSVLPVLTTGYGNISLMIVTLVVVSYLIISAIILFKNENIKIFLEYQA